MPDELRMADCGMLVREGDSAQRKHPSGSGLGDIHSRSAFFRSLYVVARARRPRAAIESPKQINNALAGSGTAEMRRVPLSRTKSKILVLLDVPSTMLPANVEVYSAGI